MWRVTDPCYKFKIDYSLDYNVTYWALGILFDDNSFVILDDGTYVSIT